MMFQTMVDCTNPLLEVLNKEIKLGGPIDIKDMMARFTTDIIGSAGFGISVNSLNDPDCEFRQFGRRSTTRNWKNLVISLAPKPLLRLVNFNPSSKENYDFLMNTVNSLIEYREKNNIYRKDFLHMMLQLKNRGKIADDEKIMDTKKTVDDGKKRQYFTVHEVATQCQTLLIGGFETSSGTMTFALLELSRNQDKQDKLRDDIKRALKKHGSMTYEAIMDMSYLDQVVFGKIILRVSQKLWSRRNLMTEDFISDRNNPIQDAPTIGRWKITSTPIVIKKI